MSDAKEKILFIVEGVKTERQIIDNLQMYFLSDSNIEIIPYRHNIYELYKNIKDDEFLDVFELLKEKNKDEDYERDDFSQIYLFFDYDGHDSKADDKTIKDMLNHFNNETENGKLLISYPMVESIKHIPKTGDFKTLTVKAKENISYKKEVGKECRNELQDLTKLTLKNWTTIIVAHLSKMSFIVYGDFKYPEDIIDQDDLFAQQLAKYIKPNQEVAVLSAFPACLLDYYGIQRLKEKYEN